MKASPLLLRAAPLLGVLLSGCSGLFHSTAAPEQTYYLRAPALPAGTTPPAPASAPAVSLRVTRPAADPGLDTTHILLLQPDHRMSFYARGRWAGAIPDVVGALTVQTLRASGEWASVEDAASPFPSDYLLQITVRRFDADYGSGTAAPEVHVRFECIIGRRDGRDVVGTFVVAGNASAAANRLGEVVNAFAQATDSAIEALRQQALQVVRADVARAPQNATTPAPSRNRHSQ